MDLQGTYRPEQQTALVAEELARYNIDIAALSEIRLPGYDSMVDCGYTIFWSGKEETNRREGGVGFAIRNTLAELLVQDPTPISDRIISMRLPLANDCHASIVSMYASTLSNPEKNKELFYRQLRGVIWAYR